MTTDAPLKLFDVVALTVDLPVHRLQRGQVGTVVDVYKDGAVEVEFSGNDGVAYAMLALQSDQLMVLFHVLQQEV